MSENRRAPRTAFKPGQSGNPGGRPKSTLNKTLAKLLAKKCPGEKFSNEEEICQKVIDLARRGDKEMIGFIWDKMEGKTLPADASGALGGLKFTLTLGDGDAAPKTENPA